MTILDVVLIGIICVFFGIIIAALSVSDEVAKLREENIKLIKELTIERLRK